VSELLSSASDDPPARGRNDPEEVLTLEEAAELLRVTIDAVEEAVISAGLPGRRLGGAWRFSRAAILAWLAFPDLSTRPAGFGPPVRAGAS
jgi:excisionase family DNA binding protein